MQVGSVIKTPIRKCFGVVRRMFTPSAQLAKSAASGADALASQNRVFVRPANQVDPERVDFKSTKEMLQYAKNKIVPPLETEKPYEYTVVANIKDNKVLAEYTGAEHKCTLENLESLPIDEENTVVIHGHPDSYPISSMDMTTLLKYKLNQVIAIDKNGQFSLVAKRAGVPAASVKSKEFRAYDYACMDNTDMYMTIRSEKMLKELTHDTLTNHADKMGLRYVTNYDYLRGKK